MKKATGMLTKLTIEIEVLSQPTIRPAQLQVDLMKTGGDPSLGISLASDKDAVIVAGILPGSAAYR
jgi:hypothetical protein